MKVKLAVLVNNQALQTLMEQPMPSATAFRVVKAIKSVGTELEAFDETRKKLIEKYGEDGEISETSKGWKKFVEEYNSLINEEVDIEVKKIKASSLAKAEISPSDLLALEWLLDE